MSGLLKQSIINSALNNVRFTYDSDGDSSLEKSPQPKQSPKATSPIQNDDSIQRKSVDLQSLLQNSSSVNSSGLSALMEQGYGSDDNSPMRRHSSPAKPVFEVSRLDLSNRSIDSSDRTPKYSPIKRRKELESEDILGVSGYSSTHEQEDVRRKLNTSNIESDRLSIVSSRYDSDSDIGSDGDHSRLTAKRSKMATMGDQEFDEAVDRLSSILQQATQIDENRASSKMLENLGKHKMDELRQGFLSQKAQEDAEDLWKEVSSRVQRSLKSFSSKGQTIEDNERRKIAISIMNNINEELLRDNHPNLQAIHHPNQRLNAALLSGRKVFTKKEWGDLVSRLCRPYERKEKKIVEIVNQRKQEEEQNFTYKPYINPKSREITSSLLTLEERIRTFLHEKERGIEQKRQQLSQQEEEELTLQPKIERTSKTMVRDVNQLFTWNDEKNQKIAKIRQEMKENETVGCSFKPELSNRSKKIMGRKKQKDVYSRNYEYEFEKQRHKEQQKLKYTSEESKPVPSITYKASIMEREGSFGDRMHKMAMKSIRRKQRKIRLASQPTSKNGLIFEEYDSDSDEDQYYFGDHDEDRAGIDEEPLPARPEQPSNVKFDNQDKKESSDLYQSLSMQHRTNLNEDGLYQRNRSLSSSFIQPVDSGKAPAHSRPHTPSTKLKSDEVISISSISEELTIDMSGLEDMVRHSPVNTKYQKTLETIRRFHEFRQNQQSTPHQTIAAPPNTVKQISPPRKASPIHRYLSPTRSVIRENLDILPPHSDTHDNDEDLATLRVLNTSLEAIKQIYKSYSKQRKAPIEEQAPEDKMDVFSLSTVDETELGT
jgi:hypothetical protein